MKPVGEHAGVEIDALLGAALASVPRDPVTGKGRGAGPAIDALLGQVHTDYGWPGIYRVALGCARICTAGIGSGSDIAYSHFGEVGELQPETPTGYRVSRFVVALMQGREADAWLEFIRWQPDESSPPSPELRQALLDLLTRAWNRQAGIPLTYTIAPGDRWPPVCDFCCVATAHVMFRCRPFQMVSPDGAFGGDMGGVQLQYTDVEYWYACRTCAKWVQADDWAALWRRHVQCNPRGSNPGNVRRGWAGFAKNRIRRRPYRLPTSRPDVATTAPRPRRGLGVQKGSGTT